MNDGLFETPPVVKATGFDDLWAAWPRRVAKLAGLKAYNRAIKRGITPEFLFQAALRYSDLSKRKDAQFILHLSTWINGERWSDDLAFEERATSGPGTTSPRSWGDERQDDIRGFVGFTKGRPDAGE